MSKEFTSTDAVVLAAGLETLAKMLVSGQAFSAYIDSQEAPTVQMTTQAFRRLFREFTLEERTSSGYPLAAVAQMGRVQFFTLIPAAEVAGWQTSIQPTPVPAA